MSSIELTIIDLSGAKHIVEAEIGEPLMKAAKRHIVPGIDADCGGSASCGTCQVIIPAEHREHMSEMQGIERDMLEFTSIGQDGCRLSCQITVTDHMNGMKITVAET